MRDLFALTEQAIAGLHFELVDVERAPLGLLRVIIDHENGIGIDDCESVSRLLSRVFEVENIDYNRLEVSSPGTDRPLKKESDFHRFLGHRVEVKFHDPIGNRKVFKGILDVNDDGDDSSNSQNTLETTKGAFRLILESDSKSKKKVKDESVSVINFVFSDVDKAKLDPILNFRGKKNES